MVRLLRTLAVWVVVSSATAAMAHSARAERIALVIGNAAYRHAETLPNPRNDAEAIAATLERLGFAVDLRVDLDQVGLRHALRDFGLATERAEVALVFYAGHGIQVAGENYLLPVDAMLERERDLLYEAMPLSLVIGEVAQATSLGVVILDACRDNPLAERMRRALGPVRAGLVGPGLARVEQLPRDTLVAFSTRPGQVAIDGEGKHSPFTAALLEHIEEPGLELNLLFRTVRDHVLGATGRRQEPRTYDALGAEPFYFKPPRPNRLPLLPPTPRLEVAVDGGPTPLFTELPSDPDGDPLSAEVAGLPARGDVLIGERLLHRGDLLTIEELGRAVYRPVGGAGGAAGSFDYVVQDDRGGAVLGRVPITVVGASPPAVAEAASELPLPGPDAPAIGTDPQAPVPTEAVSSGETSEAELDLTAQDWRAVQQGLNRLGHDAGPEDGVSGPRTRRALAAWQRAQGAEPSGYLRVDQLEALRVVAATTVARAPPDGERRGEGAADLMAGTPRGAATQLAYVWAHEPQTTSYVPSTLYNRSPDGTATVRRSGVGLYAVELGPVLERPGANVQVSSYGERSEYCNLDGWGAGTARVRCFAAGGAPGDANFSLLVVRAGPDDSDIAYAQADQPTRPSYAAPADTAHNATGPVLVSRAETGRYALQFGAIAGVGANLQVTTVGAAGERCAVERWTEGRVQVRCTARDGRPGDAAFSVLVVRSDREPPAEAPSAARFVYLWAPEQAQAEFRVPADYTHDPAQDIRVTRSSTGRYVVRLGPVIGERGGNAQVTAYGAGDRYCKVERWYAEEIEVRCFDPAGQPANAPFSLLFARAAGD